MGIERRYMRRVSAVRCENRHTKHTHRLGVELSAAPPNIIKTDKTHSRCGFRKTSRAAHGLTAMAYCAGGTIVMLRCSVHIVVIWVHWHCVLSRTEVRIAVTRWKER